MTQGENASNRDDKEGGSPIETEGDHDMKQISSPQVSLPPTPAMTNRPPSAASTHSNTSGSRMTTTSRRGGRTRSRSPPSIINSRKDYDHACMEGRSGSPADSPSAAAAAAAAAAAKAALSSSSGGRNPSHWYEGRGEDTRREDGRHRHGYEFQGSRNWPGEEAAADTRQHYRQSRPRDMEDPHNLMGSTSNVARSVTKSEDDASEMDVINQKENRDEDDCKREENKVGTSREGSSRRLNRVKKTQSYSPPSTKVVSRRNNTGDSDSLEGGGFPRSSVRELGYHPGGNNDGGSNLRTTSACASDKMSPEDKLSIRGDESSFSIFAQSFDAEMSDSESYFRDLRHLPPSCNIPSFRNPPAVDITLPTLAESENETDDISPIKLGPEVQHDTSVIEPFALRRQRMNEASSGRDSVALHRTEKEYRPTGHSYSNPIFVLRSCSKAFSQCMFLISHVRNPNVCPVNLNPVGRIHHYQSQCNVDFEHYNPNDLVVAKRRVKTAVCAFGGCHRNVEERPTNCDAIFGGVDTSKNHQSEYSQQLGRRYYLTSNRISWEVEEFPPVFADSNTEMQTTRLSSFNNFTRKTSENPEKVQFSSYGAFTNQNVSSPSVTSASTTGSNSTTDTTAGDSFNDLPKMKYRYRCKLCGQPKQNHNCPYRQLMQRSIGVSVLPVVNAFASQEPGLLAPALSEMNNFVVWASPLNRAQSSPRSHVVLQAAKITPENGPIKETKQHQWPQETPAKSERNKIMVPEKPRHGFPSSNEITPSSTVPPAARKRPFDATRSSSNFASIVTLYQEQFRAVSCEVLEGSFQYPPVPLTFASRKRLTDTIFALTREWPQLSEELSTILYGARQQDLWDLAVADLLTQIIVAFYCLEGDKRLDGLGNYLSALGISC